jgi:hypothetical protein
MAGIDDGTRYQMAASNYDLCFTRDGEFSRRVLSKRAARLKLVHVVIPQTRQDEFCAAIPGRVSEDRLFKS